MVQITMFKQVGWEVRMTMLEVLGVVTTLEELIIIRMSTTGCSQ
jgi:hypothetical protein